MERPALIFEYSPLFLILCLALGFGYAFLTYSKVGPWGAKWNKVLFVLRCVMATFIAILLVSPIWRQLQNEIEKSTFVVAIDNSQSMQEGVDSTLLNQVLVRLNETTDILQKSDYNVEFRTISDKRINTINTISFDAKASNLNELIGGIEADYEGRNLGGIVLVSDGIHNQGLLPTFVNYSNNLYTVGVGDSIPKSDIILNALLYNQVSYQGNKFPMVVQIKQKGYTNRTLGLTVYKGSNRVLTRTIRLQDEDKITEVKLELEASEAGYQSYEVTLENFSDEFNALNNSKKAYIEVIDGKEKIALVAPSPHPDIKAIRSAIESNQNYTFEQYVLSIPEQRSKLAATKEKFDLVILHQLPDVKRQGASFVQRFVNDNSSILWIYGGLTDVRLLNTTNNLMQLDLIRGEYDQVTANFNQAFGSFSLSDELQRSFDDFPPLTVPFGKISSKNDVAVLLNQRVGSLNTKKPLVSVVDNDGVRSGLILGSDIWRWKLADYARNENNMLFNELIGKLVQYLSSKEDKRKFKTYPLKAEFRTSEPVIFESEAYNALYERIYGNKVDLKITDENGQDLNYSYVPTPSNARYVINGLEDGVYRYQASSVLGEEKVTVRGEFLVKEVQLERLDLTADFGLLRNLAKASGGQFYLESELDELNEILRSKPAQAIIHTNEKYLPFINLQWIFILILFLITAEWFIRKFNGSY
ncbi:MAG: hypothetical protein AAGF85_02825 [Bacteroidota bacterium]